MPRFATIAPDGDVAVRPNDGADGRPLPLADRVALFLSRESDKGCYVNLRPSEGS